MGYRRKLLYFRRIIWAQKKSIKQKEKDILERYCGVKPERTVDPETGQVNLKYDPKDINGDYYF
jgi:hypothetical protein